jgi:molybdate transport system regulatory protein
MKSQADNPFKLQTRLRVRVHDEIALGPGKIELLEEIADTGSITHAARQLDMSYMRAWTLIRTMNACFKQPLVVSARGGKRGGGGARLTPLGKEVLDLYRKMDSKCLHAAAPEWQKLQKSLKL